MNEEIHSITIIGKTAKNEWKGDDPEFLWALCSVYKRMRTILFPCLLVNLFKLRYISSVKSYKFLSKSVG